MAGIFKRLSANDIKITPFEAHKQYNTVDLASIGATTESLEWSGLAKDTFTTGSRLYYQIDKLYYRDYIKKRAYRLELDDATYTTQERRLYQSASVLSLSQKTFGSEVQPGSFELSGSKGNFQFFIKDDGFGNLYSITKGKDNFPNEDYRLLYLGPTQAFKRADLTIDYETGKKYVNNLFPNGYVRTVYDDSYFLNEVEFKNINFVTSSNLGFYSTKVSNNAPFSFLPTTKSLDRLSLKTLFDKTELTVTLGENTTEQAGSGGPERLFTNPTTPGNAAAAFSIDDDSGTNIESFSINFSPAIPTSKITTRLNVRYLGSGDAIEFQVNNDSSTRSEPGYSIDSTANQTYSSSINNFGDKLHSIQCFFSHSAFVNGYFACTNLELDIDDSVGDSYIKFPHQPQFNFETDDDFAINFYYDLNGSDYINSSFNGDYYILTKEGNKTVAPLPSEKTRDISLRTSGSSQIKTTPIGNQFPYRIYYKGNHPNNDTASLFFERSDGENTQFVSASFFLREDTSESKKFISCRNDNGELKLTINDQIVSSSEQNSPSLTKTVSNKADITLYNKPKPDGSYSNFIGYGGGQLSQLMIWNQNLSETEVTNISESIVGTPNVGNIFYDNGFVVITHPTYMDVFNGGELNTLKYKNTHLITENEYQCTMTEDEFEFTTNPTARKVPFSDSEDIADFTTGSNFKPYITSVGLYDDMGNLLVVGKLAQPIKASSETDTTFVIRYDT